jgi:hypothetical protein
MDEILSTIPMRLIRFRGDQPMDALRKLAMTFHCCSAPRPPSKPADLLRQRANVAIVMNLSQKRPGRRMEVGAAAGPRTFGDDPTRGKLQESERSLYSACPIVFNSPARTGRRPLNGRAREFSAG